MGETSLEARLGEVLLCLEGDEDIFCSDLGVPRPLICSNCAARPAVRALLVEVAKRQREVDVDLVCQDHDYDLADFPLITDARGET